MCKQQPEKGRNLNSSVLDYLLNSTFLFKETLTSSSSVHIFQDRGVTHATTLSKIVSNNQKITNYILFLAGVHLSQGKVGF